MAQAVQHPVPDRLLVHIGDMTVSFALVELSIQILVGSLILEHQEIGRIITAELSFKQLRALAISLYKARHGEDADFDTLRKLIKRAAQLEQTRNVITHSIWGAGRSPETVTRIKTTAKEKRGIHSESVELDAGELASVAFQLKSLAGEIQGFWLSLLDRGKAINSPCQKIWPRHSDRHGP